MNVLQGSSVGDVSLDGIAVMAQANGENSSSTSGRWETKQASGTRFEEERDARWRVTKRTTYEASGSVEYHTGTQETRNNTTHWRQTTVETRTYND